MAAGTKGKLVQIIGAVVDVEFPADQLPDIYNAIQIPREDGSTLIAETQQHLGNNWVRAVAMSTTDGLRRGMEAIDVGSPIMVPVGPETLGRIFNVLGDPIDLKGEVDTDQKYPIHRPAPSFEDQEVTPQIFETGLKVVDLIAPFKKGGKIGVYLDSPTGTLLGESEAIPPTSDEAPVARRVALPPTAGAHDLHFVFTSPDPGAGFLFAVMTATFGP